MRAGVEVAQVSDEFIAHRVKEQVVAVRGAEIVGIDVIFGQKLLPFVRLDPRREQIPAWDIVVVVDVREVLRVLQFVRVVLLVQSVIINIVFVGIVEAAPVERAVLGVFDVRRVRRFVEGAFAFCRVHDARLCGRGACARAAVVGNGRARPVVGAADHVAAAAVRKILEVRVGKRLRIRAGLARAVVFFFACGACAQRKHAERKEHEESQEQCNDPQFSDSFTFCHRKHLLHE